MQRLNICLDELSATLYICYALKGLKFCFMLFYKRNVTIAFRPRRQRALCWSDAALRHACQLLPRQYEPTKEQPYWPCDLELKSLQISAVSHMTGSKSGILEWQLCCRGNQWWTEKKLFSSKHDVFTWRRGIIWEFDVDDFVACCYLTLPVSALFPFGRQTLCYFECNIKCNYTSVVGLRQAVTNTVFHNSIYPIKIF